MSTVNNPVPVPPGVRDRPVSFFFFRSYCLGNWLGGEATGVAIMYMNMLGYNACIINRFDA